MTPEDLKVKPVFLQTDIVLLLTSHFFMQSKLNFSLFHNEFIRFDPNKLRFMDFLKG